MENVLANLSIPDLGATALLSVVVLMILTDRLVTRRRLEDAQAERDHWRDAHDNLARERAVEREQMGTLIDAVTGLTESSETTRRLLTSLRDAAEQGRKG